MVEKKKDKKKTAPAAKGGPGRQGKSGREGRRAGAQSEGSGPQGRGRRAAQAGEEGRSDSGPRSRGGSPRPRRRRPARPIRASAWGRGPGSGHGKTAGTGNKGQKSRSGYRHQRGFEGGQMPLHRRVPKRGFTNIFRVEYDVVNVADLARIEGNDPITPETLAVARLSRRNRPVKILGDGEVSRALTVSAHKFSAAFDDFLILFGLNCKHNIKSPIRDQIVYLSLNAIHVHPYIR